MNKETRIIIDDPQAPPAKENEAAPLRRNGVKMPRGSKPSLLELRPGASSGWHRRKLLEPKFNWQRAADEMGGSIRAVSIWSRANIIAVSILAERPALDGTNEHAKYWRLSIADGFTSDRKPDEEEIRKTRASFGMLIPGVCSWSVDPNDLMCHYVVAVDPKRRSITGLLDAATAAPPSERAWVTQAKTGVVEFSRAMASHGKTSDELDEERERDEMHPPTPFDRSDEELDAELDLSVGVARMADAEANRPSYGGGVTFVELAPRDEPPPGEDPAK